MSPVGPHKSFVLNDPARYLENVSIFGVRFVPMLTRVPYLKALIEWVVALGNELGGPERAQDMLKGRGVSLILKSVSIKYKRPVTYPDTVSDLMIPCFRA